MSPRLLAYVLLVLMIGLAVPGPLPACFGPKLYLGTEASSRHDLLFALVALYVKEKTGTETVRVDLAGENPLNAMAEERVDMALLPLGSRTKSPILAFDGQPALVLGPRPLEDLQFTTVVPALQKLAGLLTKEDVRNLEKQVASGQAPLAAVRSLLMDRGWI